MKICILDGYSVNPGDLTWDKIRNLGETTVYERTAPSQIVDRAGDAEIILTNKVPLDSDTLSRLPRLRYIGVLATGYNIIDTSAAASRSIVVANIPAYSTMSVAQMVFALLLAATNRVEHYARENSEGRWSRNPDFCYWDTPLVELAGKRMGIVGLGHTGMATARIALAFGMDVTALTSKDAGSLPEGIRKAASTDELFATCDVVSLNCPLTPDTRHLANARTLALMKPGAILINTGRGPLVDEEAVAKALGAGRLGAYGADVMGTEPPAADNPLLSAPRAFITPHIAWATREARQRLMDICRDNLGAFINGQPQNIVNPW